MFSRTVILALVLASAFTQQSGTPAPQEPVQPVAAAAPAPAATPAHAPVSEGPSTLYFYRPRLYRGGAVRIGIFVDGTMAVNLVNGRWASIQIPAGHHVSKPKE